MKKYRITKQEQLIYEVMLENKIHPTIKEIYKLVKEKHNRIGQATIYRNMLEQSKIRRVYIENTDIRYDIETLPHSHMNCLKCKKIYDIDDEIIINYNKYLLDKYNFDVKLVEVNITSVCNNCKI